MARERYRPPHPFGLGGVAIGNEFQFATDEQAQATLAAAWDAGVRYFDVSPWYGRGSPSDASDVSWRASRGTSS